MKTLTYSYVKYSLRVPLLLLTVEKIEHENFDFVLFSKQEVGTTQTSQGRALVSHFCNRAHGMLKR